MEYSEVVLITGGCGFLGLNLLHYIAENNLASTCILVDNGITCNLYDAIKKIQAWQLQYPLLKIHFYKMDICSENFSNTMIQKYSKITQIYHFASLASPVFYRKYPLQTLDVGYIGTKRVLDLARRFESKVLFASTSEVYGDPTVHPQKESYYGNVNSYGTRSAYDESKRVAEALLYTYKELYNLETRIVRIFNTYGPHMNIDDGRIVTEICRALLTNKPLKIFGDGTQTRSLNYVDDTIRAIVGVMNSDYSSPINVGNDAELSINELVKECQKVYRDNFDPSAELHIVYTAIDKDDPKIRQPCLQLHKEVLGNYPKTPLREGLYKTMKYFSERM
jgi:dTDP-glucose 4,6-dehydratase